MQKNGAIYVSVVVPCRNESRYIRAFLESVFCQELGGIEMEVLIADGMSSDGTREVLAEFEKKLPALRILDNPEKIVSTACNRAIREARGEIIIRMDVHTLYAPNYVRSCVEVLQEAGAGNVGGPALTRADGYVARGHCACLSHTLCQRWGQISRSAIRRPRHLCAVWLLPQVHSAGHWPVRRGPGLRPRC